MVSKLPRAAAAKAKAANTKAAGQPPQDGAGTDTAADDLAVLYPDVELTLAGRALTVREYRFIDGLRARAQAKPLIDDLAAMIDTGAAADAGVEDYLDLLATHQVLIRALMADSIEGADAQYIDGLDGADGETLLLTWWSVAGRFFTRLVLRRLSDRLLRQAAHAASAGSTFSTPSPAPNAAARSTSAGATPRAN